jgi:hypothetical protein
MLHQSSCAASGECTCSAMAQDSASTSAALSHAGRACDTCWRGHAHSMLMCAVLGPPVAGLAGRRRRLTSSRLVCC